MLRGSWQDTANPHQPIPSACLPMYNRGSLKLEPSIPESLCLPTGGKASVHSSCPPTAPSSSACFSLPICMCRSSTSGQATVSNQCLDTIVTVCGYLCMCAMSQYPETATTAAMATCRIHACDRGTGTCPGGGVCHMTRLGQIEQQAYGTVWHCNVLLVTGKQGGRLACQQSLPHLDILTTTPPPPNSVPHTSTHPPSFHCHTGEMEQDGGLTDGQSYSQEQDW